LEEAKNLRFGAKGRSGCANCRETGREVMMSWQWSSQAAEAEKAEAEKALPKTARRPIAKPSNARFPT
jgi:hypothetical protein